MLLVLARFVLEVLTLWTFGRSPLTWPPCCSSPAAGGASHRRQAAHTSALQPMEIFVDDEAKLTLHGLVQHYIMLNEDEKNRKLNDLLDALDFNQVSTSTTPCGTVCISTY